MGKRKTTEQFKREVYDLVVNEYEVLSEYVAAHNKLTMKHVRCGFVYPVTPNKFLGGRRCPKCNRGHTMTTEEFKQRVYDLVGESYKVLGEYTLYDHQIEMEHECDYRWCAIPKHFLAGSRCPRCAGNLKITQKQFEREIFRLEGEEYQVIGEYENTDKAIEMIHHKCSRFIKISRSKFLEGNRCRYCYYEQQGVEQRKKTEEYINELNALTGNEFKVVSEYTGAYQPIKIKHNECGQSFELSAARNMLVHPSCRICNEVESNGEKLVRKELEKRNWHFKQQYRFADCRDRYPLPFDFAIFSPAGSLQFLIEFDGHGHYQPVNLFGGNEQFEDRKRKDHLKNEYCGERGILLLRIPYFESKNLKALIDQFVVEHQLKIG